MSVDWNATYREPLCEADNKGRKFFSPLCNPNYNPPKQQDVSVSVQTRTSSWPDADCSVPPVHRPTPQVKQFTDQESAYDWFKDPTYAQRVAARRRRISDSVLETNPSLQLYHKLKLREKVAGSLMQSL